MISADAQHSLQCFIGFDVARSGATPRAGQLLGDLSLVVKDNIDVASWATTAGTPAFVRTPVRRSASIVQTLLDAGAVVVGKTNMHELAFGVTSHNAAFGSVRNPLDTQFSAGGSSGGSAAAVAAKLVRAALGTDTGGSIRVPAAFCGVVGFRPSAGRYSSDGVVPLAASRDTIGLLTDTVELARRLDACIAQDASAGFREIPPRLTLGVPAGFLTEDLSESVSAAWSRALNALRAHGHTIVSVDVRGLWELIDRTSPVVTAFELVRDFSRAILSRTAGLTSQEFVASIASPDVRAIFQALIIDGRGPTAEQYAAATAADLPAMRSLIDNLFREHALDAWIFPTVPFTAFPLTANEAVLHNGKQLPLFRTTVRNLQQASLIGMPSISLPMPTMRSPLPAGLCIEALPGDDARLLALAASLSGTI